jgi:hypothetical protein
LSRAKLSSATIQDKRIKLSLGELHLFSGTNKTGSRKLQKHGRSASPQNFFSVFSCLFSSQELAKPTSDLTSFDFKRYMSTESEMLTWKAEGLPSDDLSVENAIVLLHTKQVPLVIDPSAQAAEWLKKHLRERVASMEVVRCCRDSSSSWTRLISKTLKSIKRRVIPVVVPFAQTAELFEEQLRDRRGKVLLEVFLFFLRRHHFLKEVGEQISEGTTRGRSAGHHSVRSDCGRAPSKLEKGWPLRKLVEVSVSSCISECFELRPFLMIDELLKTKPLVIAKAAGRLAKDLKQTFPP